MNRRGNLQYNRVAVTACVICVLGGLLLSAMTKNPAPLLIGIFIGLYLLHAIKVVQAVGEGRATARGALRGGCAGRGSFSSFRCWRR